MRWKNRVEKDEEGESLQDEKRYEYLERIRGCWD